MPSPSPELADAVRATSQRLGISPSDLMTVISYETGGRMDPNIWGGTRGQHLGYIQFSPDNQSRYGVKPGMTPSDQMGAVESYLRDRGVKPGMGMLDLYAAVNAGAPGLYNRTDANNGGMPGTVADKVATQMVGHRARANALLGIDPQAAQQQPVAPAAIAPTTAQPTAPSAATSPVPGSFAPGMTDQTEEAQQQAVQAPLQAIPQGIAKDTGPQFLAAPAINYPATAAMIRARAMARAAAQRQDT